MVDMYNSPVTTQPQVSLALAMTSILFPHMYPSAGHVLLIFELQHITLCEVKVQTDRLQFTHLPSKSTCNTIERNIKRTEASIHSTTSLLALIILFSP